MEYPDNFDTIAFPFGKDLALMRTIAIWVSMLFIVIAFLSFLIVWTSKSDKLKAYVLSTDRDTQRIVLVSNKKEKQDSLPERVLQESLIVGFLNNWFNVSSKDLENTLWKKCNREECTSEDLSNTCAIYCNSSEELYSKFLYNTVPIYNNILENGDKWTLIKDSLEIKPLGNITNFYGFWSIKGIVKTTSRKINFVGFITVLKNVNLYPKNLGFYIQNFSSYGLN